MPEKRPKKPELNKYLKYEKYPRRFVFISFSGPTDTPLPTPNTSNDSQNIKERGDDSRMNGWELTYLETLKPQEWREMLSKEKSEFFRNHPLKLALQNSQGVNILAIIQ